MDKVARNLSSPACPLQGDGIFEGTLHTITNKEETESDEKDVLLLIPCRDFDFGPITNNNTYYCSAARRPMSGRWMLVLVGPDLQA